MTQHAAQDGCPEVGTGPWVGYASGLLHRPPYDPKVETLIRAIEVAVDVLERAGDEERWVRWLRADRDRIRRRDPVGLEHLLGAFGGMGSLSDVLLHAANGNRGTTEELRVANERLTTARAEMARRAAELLHEARQA